MQRQLPHLEHFQKKINFKISTSKIIEIQIWKKHILSYCSIVPGATPKWLETEKLKKKVFSFFLPSFCPGITHILPFACSHMQRKSPYLEN